MPASVSWLKYENEVIIMAERLVKLTFENFIRSFFT